MLTFQASLGEILADRDGESSGRFPAFRTYRVPQFQRNYAWTSNEWNDLWLDLEDLEKEAKAGNENAVHYMGYLILTPENGKTRMARIVDGQQRLATLTILMIACAEQLGIGRVRLNGVEGAGKGDHMMDAYVGQWSPVSQSVPSPRLVLNRNDNGFFRNHILKGTPPITFSRRPPSNRLLWEALEFFRDKLRSKFPAGENRGDKIGGLAEMADQNLAFTVMSLPDNLSAYRVFETLNARGMELSAGDLVKNLLFSVAGDHLRDEMEQRWDGAEKEVGGRNMTDFLTCLWNAENEMASEERNLYRQLRKGVRTAEDAFQFISKAEEQAQTYQALQDPPTEWRGNKKIAGSLAILANDFGARQQLPMLLTAWQLVKSDRMRHADFFQLVRMAEFAHFRHVTISRQPSVSLEIAHNRIARSLYDAARGDERGYLGKSARGKALQILQEMTVNDGVFRQHFGDAEFDARGRAEKRVVRYILQSMENHMRKTLTPNPSIEHILPFSEQAAGDHWPAFSAEERESYARRLGNYCLLTENDNEKCGHKPYDKKKPIYNRSVFLTANRWVYDEWTPEHLLDRQERMAELAVEIWRLE